MAELCEYHSLPGVQGGRLKGPMARTVTDFRHALVSNRACSAAGDHGAIMVWQDDGGKWRAAFMRYSETLESEIFATKAAISPWLRAWLPKMREPVHG
jgi:hypothetical protein